MPRLSSLLTELRALYPDDWYLREAQEDFMVSAQFRSLLRTYDRALDVLDVHSWATLKQKAIHNFSSNTKDRGKQAFFNHLNEAFAYRYLLQRGCECVTFVPDDKKRKTPDLTFTRDNAQRFCEVKTISISDKEIDRSKLGESFDGSIYSRLTEELLQGKLLSVLSHARDQLQSCGAGIVYLIVNFDDFTLTHYATYKRQFVELLESQFPTLEVYVKVGVQSRKRIHHRGSSVLEHA